MFNSIFTKTFLLATLLLMFSNVNAQRLSVNQGILSEDDKTQPCIEVMMEPTAKEVKKEFKDFLNDQYDVKLKGIGFLSNKDVLTAERTTIPTVSAKAMDLSVEVIPAQDKTKMCVAGSFGYDIAIDRSDYPREYRALRGIVLDFLDNYLPEYYQGRVEETAEVVAELTDQRNDITEDIADNKDEIEKLKKENEALKTELENTKKDLELQASNLDKRKSELNDVNKELRKKNK